MENRSADLGVRGDDADQPYCNSGQWLVTAGFIEFTVQHLSRPVSGPNLYARRVCELGYCDNPN